jgi:hypothetical protein
MRGKSLVGLVLIAAAAPLCAQADAVSKADLWNSWRAGPAEPLAMHAQAATDARIVDARIVRQSDAAAAARTISVASAPVLRAVAAASATTAPSRAVRAAAVQATAVPEMNTGLAAAGLTLLLGGVAVLRSGRARFNG